MHAKSAAAAAGILLAAMALAGCSSTPAHATKSTPRASTSSAAAASDFDEAPAVGSTATAAPYPDCPLQIANWTATATGKPWVTVMSVDGVDTVTATVTLTSGATEKQTFTIPGGEDTHIFEFNDVAPASIKSVLVTASGNARSQGGSCAATGGPNA